MAGLLCVRPERLQTAIGAETVSLSDLVADVVPGGVHA